MKAKSKLNKDVQDSTTDNVSKRDKAGLRKEKQPSANKNPIQRKPQCDLEVHSAKANNQVKTNVLQEASVKTANKVEKKQRTNQEVNGKSDLNKDVPDSTADNVTRKEKARLKKTEGSDCNPVFKTNELEKRKQRCAEFSKNRNVLRLIFLQALFNDGKRKPTISAKTRMFKTRC